MLILNCVSETICEINNEEHFETRLPVSVNDFEEVDEDTLENLPEITPENFHQLPDTEKISLATQPRQHLSNGCEEFFEKCSQKLLFQPLEANFHFCSEVKEDSKRKRSLSLHLSTRSNSPLFYGSGNCTPPNKRYDFSPDLEKDCVDNQIANDGLKRMRFDSPEVLQDIFDNRACERRYRYTFCCNFYSLRQDCPNSGPGNCDQQRNFIRSELRSQFWPATRILLAIANKLFQ